MTIHDLARKFLSEKPGLNFSDTKKKSVFEFADWIAKQGQIIVVRPRGASVKQLAERMAK